MQVLHSEEGNRNTHKLLIAAQYCGVHVERSTAIQTGVSDKTHVLFNPNVFLDRNLVGKVPVLETPDGLIVESNTMARYVAKFKGDKILCGSSPYEFARIEQWMTFATAGIEEVIIRWVYTRNGVYSYNHQAERFLIYRLRKYLWPVNLHLAKNKYLTGNYVTLADIFLTCNLYWGFTNVMPKSFTSEFPHLERYFWDLVDQPNFKKILGEVKQAGPLPVLRLSRRNFVPRPEVVVAVKKRKAYQMEARKEGGVSASRMVELAKEYAMELQQEHFRKARIQVMEAEKMMGIHNHNQPQKVEGLNHMIEETHEKLSIIRK